MKDITLLRCSKCGKVVEFIPSNDCCPTICCGQPMDKMVANSKDAALEKHVPVVTVEGDEVKVEVGSVLHPMLEEHHIAFIILVTDKEVKRVDLNPGEKPVHTFKLAEGEKPLKVYEFCNLHGLWVTEL